MEDSTVHQKCPYAPRTHIVHLSETAAYPPDAEIGTEPCVVFWTASKDFEKRPSLPQEYFQPLEGPKYPRIHFVWYKGSNLPEKRWPYGYKLKGGAMGLPDAALRNGGD